jgi:hypothetical protein
LLNIFFLKQSTLLVEESDTVNEMRIPRLQREHEQAAPADHQRRGKYPVDQTRGISYAGDFQC